jgi:hypothetical protein
VSAVIDHLVIAADSLDQGAAWSEATFGIQPSGGGKHPLMGTHNRVIAISSESFPDCYLEVIAIDADAPPPGRPRWFGLDHPEVREAVRESPRLVHAVARTHKIEMLQTTQIDAVQNPPLTATLESPRGHVVLDAWRSGE